jgi:hypothetical protein
MGDVPQSDLPAIDARELQGDRPRAGNVLPRYRKDAPLCLRRLRLQAH